MMVRYRHTSPKLKKVYYLAAKQRFFALAPYKHLMLTKFFTRVYLYPQPQIYHSLVQPLNSTGSKLFDSRASVLDAGLAVKHLCSSVTHQLGNRACSKILSHATSSIESQQIAVVIEDRAFMDDLVNNCQWGGDDTLDCVM